MNKPTLYNIAAEELRICDMLEDNGGELTPEIEEALAINEENFVAKVDSYSEVILSYKAKGEAIANRIKELTTMKRVCDNIEKRMKERLVWAMETMGRDKVEVGFHKLSFRNSTAVNITDEANIPNQYIKVETSVDKMAIKRDLAAGIEVKGAELITNKSLQIR